MTGINKVFESHSAVIVLEDDLELDLFYLDFMNKSLNRYADDENIRQRMELSTNYKRKKLILLVN